MMNEQPAEIKISTRIKIPENSPWFAGHFPDDPVFPGIAQLDMVAAAVAEFKQDDLWIKKLSRIKFRKLIRPGDELSILAVGSKEKNSYSFRIIVAGQEACSGVMSLAGRYENARKGETITAMENDISKTILRVAEIIINELKLEDVTPKTFAPDLDLVDEVGVDSMDLATVALVLRDEYGIRIDEDDYPKLTTVRIIAEYINEKLRSDD